MAQEPDAVSGDALSDRDASTDSYTPDAQRHPADLERDIERTRAEMSETIDAIGARFQPAYIKEQAKEAVRETARDAGTSMIDTLRENPLPAAIAGLSIAWLFANRAPASRRPPDRYQAYGRGGYDAGMGYGPGRGYDRYGVRDHGAREYGSADDGVSIGERAGDALDTVRERASDMGSQIAESVQGVQQQAGDVGQRAMTWLEDQMDRNPLGVGAVALAAGALVGLSLPTTDTENAWLGQHSDQLTDKVTAVASEKLGQVKEVASAVAEEAKAKAGEVVETAKEKAGEVADAARQEASQSTASGSGSGRPAGIDKPAGTPSVAQGASSGHPSPASPTSGGTPSHTPSGAPGSPSSGTSPGSTMAGGAGSASAGGLSSGGAAGGSSHEHIANVNHPDDKAS